MKRLFVLLFAVVALSCSCTKENVEPQYQQNSNCWDCITKTVRTDYNPYTSGVPDYTTTYAPKVTYCDKTIEWITQHEDNGYNISYNYALDGVLMQTWVRTVKCTKQ